MMNSKLFTLLLISALSIYPVKNINSCGWDGWDVDESHLKPFDQELIEFPGYYPFLFSEHYWNRYNNWYYYDEEGGEDIFDSKGANINDWSSYFGGKFSKSEIESIVYLGSLDDYKNVIQVITGKSNEVPSQFTGNTIVDQWKINNSDPAIKYILFAREVEPLVAGTSWWDIPVRDTVAMTERKAEALKAATKSKNDFIRLRYLYQAMRLAHYTGNYEECIKLFDEKVAPMKNESVVNYWCLSLKAGANWRRGNFAESSYYNSIVFDKCPSRRLYAERDFWIDNENTWQQCLSMCKNDHERNILWLLTGINQNNSALPALKQMLQYEPGSAEIELLLAREIEKVQRNTMPARRYYEVESDYENSYAPEANDKDELFDFIKSGLDTRKVRTPSFWYSAAALIQLINKNYAEADQYCEFALEEAGGNEAFINQARVLKLLIKVEEYGKINPQIENELLEDLEWLASNDSPIGENTFKLVMFRMMHYYDAAGDALDREMCRANAVEYYDIFENPSGAPVDELYVFFTDENRRPMQLFLSSLYPYDEDDMLEIKGTLLMREYKWAEAVTAFSKMKRADHYTLDLLTDPFLIHTYDCHDCDFDEYPDDYTKISFAKEMLRMENELKMNPANKAELYHRLANGYYNITHFGNSWMAVDYYLHAAAWDWSTPDAEEREEFYDCSKAEFYYNLAAQHSSDREFQALNIFMAAKCEQNRYYMSEDYDFENTNGKKDNYRSNFALLMNKYSNTDFYQQAIDECKYFEYYVSKH